MHPIHILTFAGLIFLGAFVASFSFGFVKGYREARGKPLAENTLALMGRFEWVVEVLVVIGVTAALTVREPENAFANAFYAFAVAILVSFILDVRVFHGTLREFVTRTVIGLLVCLPLGLLLGSYANTGT